MSFIVKEIATIRLVSQDVAKSRDWYRTLLGIEPIEDLENFVSFKIGNTYFDIALADAKSPVSTGGTVGYWLVSDLELLLLRVKEIGGSIYRGPLRVEETKRTIVQILDPLGNVVGFEANF